MVKQKLVRFLLNVMLNVLLALKSLSHAIYLVAFEFQINSIFNIIFHLHIVFQLNSIPPLDSIEIHQRLCREDRICLKQNFILNYFFGVMIAKSGIWNICLRSHSMSCEV